MDHHVANDMELKVLQALYFFFKEFGPGATPNLKGLDEEAGIAKHELDDAVRSLRDKGLIEYWELAPAVRLTGEGLRLMVKLEERCEEID